MQQIPKVNVFTFSGYFSSLQEQVFVNLYLKKTEDEK